MDRFGERRDKFADALGEIGRAAIFADEIDDRAADDDGVRDTRNLGSLRRIGNAEADRDGQLDMPRCAAS